MAATPRASTKLHELAAIPGSVPDLRGALPACRYGARCEQYATTCEAPLPRVELAPDHFVACWKPL